MRATLTLDDDLAALLQQCARELGMRFKEAVNRAIRTGLGEAVADRRGPALKTIPHSYSTAADFARFRGLRLVDPCREPRGS
jgi:hypothetical protein